MAAAVGLNHVQFSRDVLRDLATAVAWCRGNGLIPAARICPQCGRDMRFAMYGKKMMYVCRRKEHGVVHCVRQSALVGTWFANAKFDFLSILDFTYYFARNLTNYDGLVFQTSRPGVKTSRETIADWTSYSREVMLEWVVANQAVQGQLGGDGVVVEIDEAKVGKRKYNRGRLVDGTWVLGLIELVLNGPRRGGRFRIVVLPDNRRDAATLIPIITANVVPGTTICTDLWGGYNQLSQLPASYEHFTVNHSRNFIDPRTGANTQTVESSWRAMKASFGGAFRKEHLLMHLAEFLFRRDVRHNNDDPFTRFVEAIVALYPGV